MSNNSFRRFVQLLEAPNKILIELFLAKCIADLFGRPPGAPDLSASEVSVDASPTPGLSGFLGRRFFQGLTLIGLANLPVTPPTGNIARVDLRAGHGVARKMSRAKNNNPKRSPLRARSLTVLLRALNEADNLEPTVRRLIEALTTTIEDFEIIIFNDGSTDGTDAIADRLARDIPNIRVFHHSQTMGLEKCYKRGCEEACKTFFVHIPGDNSWPYRSFVEFFGNLGRADIITSFVTDPDARPTIRRIVSGVYTHALNFLFRHRLRDFNGLTIYEATFLRGRPAVRFGFGFQAELLLKALATGASYIEVGLPVDAPAERPSKAVNLSHIADVCLTIIRLYWELRLKRQWQPAVVADQRAVSSGPRASFDALGFDANIGMGPSDERATNHKIIVIAGASSGIGASLAASFSEAGHTVFACSRSADRLGLAFQNYPDVHYFACDVTDETAVCAFVTYVRARTAKVDVLINCAGSLGEIGSIEQVESQAWIRTFQGNLFGAFLTIKHFVPLLASGDMPQILNFSGGGAFNPFANFSAYACSKAAIVRLTETLAVELAPRGITVNAIAPGIIKTKIHEETLQAGAERAGLLQYRRTQNLMRDNAGDGHQARMEAVHDCVSALISEEYFGLTGKTISVNFDPWASDTFRQHLADITRSELYTMSRTNLTGLPDGLLRSDLMKASARHSPQRGDRNGLATMPSSKRRPETRAIVLGLIAGLFVLAIAAH